jgi:tight adherence protein B
VNATSLMLGAVLGGGLWLMMSAVVSLRPPFTTGKTLLPPPASRRTHDHLPSLTALLDEAGIEKIDARVLLAGGVFGGALSGLLVVVLIPIPTLGVIAACVVPLAGFAYLKRLKAQRATRLRRAWPGVIDHLRAGVRSGHDVAGALTALPDSLPGDISGPVTAFDRDISRGLGTDEALGELGRRLADPVADRIVEVLRMAHEVGGVNLPGVLLELQKSVRIDIAVREDAHAKQSWIRSASVLAVCAPWAVLLLIGTREATLGAYQSPEGAGILLVGAIVSAVAFGMMKKIGSLPTQQRWLG